MKALSLLGLLFFMTAVLARGQENGEDPYYTDLITSELKLNSGGRKLVSSWSQKRLVQLGDRAAISILKTLEPSDLTNPERVSACLLIIRQAFDQPSAIKLNSDRDPKATLFLLSYWNANVKDAEVQAEIRQTLTLIKDKLAGTS